MKQVWYHGNCLDGFGAAWAAWKKLGEVGVKYQPVQHGQPMPMVQPGDEIYILDFSYPRELLKSLMAFCTVVVIDHHKTAQVELAGLPNCIFNMEKSGAVLAWEYFHPGKMVPHFLELIQDRDLWRWELRRTREFNSGLYYIVDRDFKYWDLFSWGTELNGVIQQGGVAVKVEAKLVSDIVAGGYGGPREFAGKKLAVVNASVMVSEVGNAVLEQDPQLDFAAVWSVGADGKARVSLRSRKGGFDVSVLAKQFGGGGHQAAAGFSAPLGEIAFLK